MAETWPSGRARHGGVDELPLPGRPGRLWLAGKQYVGPDPEAAMAETGATTIVCLCEEFELEDRYPDYVEWLNAGKALWFPIPDLHAPDRASALAFGSELLDRLALGDTILMHCGAGIGRAGTMAAALLILDGADLTDALAAVAAARPMAGPEAGAQMELLHQLSGQS